jgi:hypothetical protein
MCHGEKRVIEMQNIYTTLVIAAIGGSIPLIFKAVVDRGLDLFRVKDTKNIHIHKVQFEREFQAYEEIWSSIPKLSKYTDSYGDIVADKLEEDNDKEIFDMLKKFQDAYYRNEPFCHPSVYESMNDILEKYHNLLLFIEKMKTCFESLEKSDLGEEEEQPNPIVEQYLDKYFKMIFNIERDTDNIKEAIKKRIWKD